MYNHTTSEAMCPPWEGFSGLSGGAWRKIEYFPLRTKSCLSVASSFRLGKYVDFLAPERSRQSFFLLSFSFWWQKEKVNACLIVEYFNYQNLSFTNNFFPMAERKSNFLYNPIYLLNMQRSKTNPFFRKEESWRTETEIFTHGVVLIAI